MTTTQTKTQVRFNKDEFKMMQYMIGEKAHYFCSPEAEQTWLMHSTDECDELITLAQNYINTLTKFQKKFGDNAYQNTINDLIKTRDYIKEEKGELLEYEKEEKKKEEARAKLIEKQKSFKADKELLVKKLADIEAKKVQKKKVKLVIKDEYEDEDEICFCGTTYVDEECDYCKNKENDGEVSDGRYAIYIDEKLRFFKIAKGKGKYKDCIFVSEIIGGGDLDSQLIRCPNPLFREKVLFMIANDKDAHMRYSEELKECYRCGRELTDEISRKTGLGPICRGKGKSRY